MIHVLDKFVNKCIRCLSTKFPENVKESVCLLEYTTVDKLRSSIALQFRSGLKYLHTHTQTETPRIFLKLIFENTLIACLFK